jgi:hypothetical protein
MVFREPNDSIELKDDELPSDDWFKKSETISPQED